MLTRQRGNGDRHGVRHCWQAKPQNPAALVTSPHGPMRERVTGLATSTNELAHADHPVMPTLTVFRHAETAAQIESSLLSSLSRVSPGFVRAAARAAWPV
jgi:hypothetical protein